METVRAVPWRRSEKRGGRASDGLECASRKNGKSENRREAGIKDPSKKFNYIEKLYPKDSDKPAFTPGRF